MGMMMTRRMTMGSQGEELALIEGESMLGQD